MITLYLMMGCTVSGNYIYINIAWESVYAILLELITSKLILRSSVSSLMKLRFVDGPIEQTGAYGPIKSFYAQ